MKNKLFSEKLLLFKGGREQPDSSQNDRLDAAMARARLEMEAQDAARQERSKMADSIADGLMQAKSKHDEPEFSVEDGKIKKKGFDGTFEREDENGKVGDLIYTNENLADEDYKPAPNSNDEFLKFAFPGETEFVVPGELSFHSQGARYFYAPEAGRLTPTSWTEKEKKDLRVWEGVSAVYMHGQDSGRPNEYRYENSKLADKDYQPKMGTIDMYLKTKFPGKSIFMCKFQGSSTPMFEKFQPVWEPDSYPTDGEDEEEGEQPLVTPL